MLLARLFSQPSSAITFVASTSTELPPHRGLPLSDQSLIVQAEISQCLAHRSLDLFAGTERQEDLPHLMPAIRLDHEIDQGIALLVGKARLTGIKADEGL